MKTEHCHASEMNNRARNTTVEIRSLRPNVTQEEAIRLFRPGGPTHLLRNVLSGPLRSVAEAYLPFHLFRVTIVNRGRIESSVLGLDAVRGSLDPYRFEHVPTDDETIRIETRNCLPVGVPAKEAADLLVAKVRRLLYGKGFFRLQGIEISAEPLEEKLHIPYWLGFSGSRGHARLRVLDGVRRCPEGGKVRSIFEQWLESGEAGKEAHTT